MDRFVAIMFVSVIALMTTIVIALICPEIAGPMGVIGGIAACVGIGGVMYSR